MCVCACCETARSEKKKKKKKRRAKRANTHNSCPDTEQGARQSSLEVDDTELLWPVNCKANKLLGALALFLGKKANDC